MPFRWCWYTDGSNTDMPASVPESPPLLLLRLLPPLLWLLPPPLRLLPPLLRLLPPPLRLLPPLLLPLLPPLLLLLLPEVPPSPGPALLPPLLPHATRRARKGVESLIRI